MHRVIRGFSFAVIMCTLASCGEDLTPSGRALMARATYGATSSPAVSVVPLPTVSPPTAADAPEAGPRTQWIVRVDIGANQPDDRLSWAKRSRVPHESFMNGARDTLQALTDRNPHCTITAMTTVNAALGWTGEEMHGGPYTLPSGILAAFHCPNGEPMNVTPTIR